MTREAVDTNVFIALFAGGEETSSWARHKLEEASTRATLAVSPAVYAELVAGVRSPETVERFFSNAGIEADREGGLAYGRLSLRLLLPGSQAAVLGSRAEKNTRGLFDRSPRRAHGRWSALDHRLQDLRRLLPRGPSRGSR